MWPYAGYSFPRKLELLSSVIGDTTVLCTVYHRLRSLSVVRDYVEMALWSSASPWMNMIAQVIFQGSPCFVWDGLKGVCAFPWVKQKKNIFRINLPDRAWRGGCLKVKIREELLYCWHWQPAGSNPFCTVLCAPIENSAVFFPVLFELFNK